MVTHHLHCAISLNGEQWGTFFVLDTKKKSMHTGSPEGEKTTKKQNKIQLNMHLIIRWNYQGINVEVMIVFSMLNIDLISVYTKYVWTFQSITLHQSWFNIRILFFVHTTDCPMKLITHNEQHVAQVHTENARQN